MAEQVHGPAEAVVTATDDINAARTAYERSVLFLIIPFADQSAPTEINVRSQAALKGVGETSDDRSAF